MLGYNLADLIIKRLRVSGFNPSITENETFTDNTTVKGFLVDEIEFHTYEIQSNSNFTIEVDKENYCRALITEFYKCKIRIEEQKRSIEVLLENDSQIAWILVSIYYCCFFIANEISKLCGEFITNLSESDMLYILSETNYENAIGFTDYIESYNSYKVEVCHSDYDHLLLLKFTKSSPKPHSVVWSNLKKITSKLKIKEDASLFHHYSLLIAIIGNDRGWDSPSKVRNDWNYMHADLYGEKGNRLGKKFLKNANSRQAAFSWANSRKINPHEENKVASIAYLYHVLIEAYERFSEVLENKNFS